MLVYINKDIKITESENSEQMIYCAYSYCADNDIACLEEVYYTKEEAEKWIEKNEQNKTSDSLIFYYELEKESEIFLLITKKVSLWI